MIAIIFLIFVCISVVVAVIWSCTKEIIKKLEAIRICVIDVESELKILNGNYEN